MSSAASPRTSQPSQTSTLAFFRRARTTACSTRRALWIRSQLRWYAFFDVPWMIVHLNRVLTNLKEIFVLTAAGNQKLSEEIIPEEEMGGRNLGGLETGFSQLVIALWFWCSVGGIVSQSNWPLPPIIVFLSFCKSRISHFGGVVNALPC